MLICKPGERYPILPTPNPYVYPRRAVPPSSSTPGTVLLIYKQVLGMGDVGTALLIYKYVLGLVEEEGTGFLEERGIPSSSTLNAYL
jgi:hypothetical protein